MTSDILADEIYELRDQKRRVLLDEANRDTAAKKVEKLIERVIVYDDSFRVVFKSGVEVEVNN